MKTIMICLMLVLLSNSTSGQGTFLNLDFEQGHYIPIPGSYFYPYEVTTSDALPGWTAYIGDSAVSSVLYNTISLSAPAVALHGPPGVGTPFPPFHGSYSVILRASYPSGTPVAAVGQTAQIPLDAKSVVFYGYNIHLEVSFEGLPVSVYDLGGVSGQYSYHHYVADIAAFAGQTGELRFSGGSGNLDYIQFSPDPVPEPHSISLALTVLFGLAFRIGLRAIRCVWSSRNPNPLVHR